MQRLGKERVRRQEEILSKKSGETAKETLRQQMDRILLEERF